MREREPREESTRGCGERDECDREKRLDRERERDRELRDRKFGEREVRDRDVRDRDLRDREKEGSSFLIDESDVAREREYSTVLLSSFSDRVFEADLALK